jgi:hypothetical protein
LSVNPITRGPCGQEQGCRVERRTPTGPSAGRDESPRLLSLGPAEPS